MTKSILLIEDNREMRENLSELLMLANYQVETAENGKVGVKMAKSSPPDLIICDIMMPEMDGYEVLYLLGKDEKTASIPFVYLSAKSEKADWRKGMTLGADDYLTKPVEEMELLRVVEARLAKSQFLKEKFQDQKEGFHQLLDQTQGMDQLKAHCQEGGKIYEKRSVIYQEGDFASAVFFLAKGKVRTYTTNDDGKELTTELVGDGDFFGYTPVMNGSERPDSAMAMEASEVYKIHKDDFMSLLYKDREIARAFIKMLSGHLIEKERELTNLAYNSVRKRVADGLLTLQRKYLKDQEAFSISIPRDDLASLVGTSSESVIRVLSDFKQEGWVLIEGSAITIKESNSLESIRG